MQAYARGEFNHLSGKCLCFAFQSEQQAGQITRNPHLENLSTEKRREFHLRLIEPQLSTYYSLTFVQISDLFLNLSEIMLLL